MPANGSAKDPLQIMLKEEKTETHNQITENGVYDDKVLLIGQVFLLWKLMVKYVDMVELATEKSIIEKHWRLQREITYKKDGHTLSQLKSSKVLHWRLYNITCWSISISQSLVVQSLHSARIWKRLVNHWITDVSDGYFNFNGQIHQFNNWVIPLTADVIKFLCSNFDALLKKLCS